MKILTILGYLLCFGISDCLWVYPNKRFSIIVSMTIRSLITCLLFTILFLLTTHLADFNKKTDDVINAILISCVSYGGLYLYVKSLKYEQASIIAPVTTILTSLLGLIFSIIFYHEILTLKIGCCLTAAFTGIVLCYSKQYKTGMQLRFNKGTIFSIGAAILWAVSYTFFKTPVDKLGVVTFSLILELTLLLINLIFLFAGKYQTELLKLKFDKPNFSLLLIGVLIFGGTLLSSYSYKLYPLMLLNVLGKVGVIVPILYCVIFLKEKLSLVQIGGIGILVVSAIVIAS